MSKYIHGGFAGWTKITTDQGELEIRELVGSPVKIWNGQVFSECTPFLIDQGNNKDTLIVTFDNGSQIFCDMRQGFILSDNTLVCANDLKGDEWLSGWSTVQGTADIARVKEITAGPSIPLYGVEEPFLGKIMLNGVVLKACLRVTPV